jgi:uncharacterized membrane protein YkoI
MKTLSCSFVAVLLVVPTLFAADKKIQAKDLPPVVQAAVQESTRGAVIKGYAREVEGGKTMFEVETTVNGHSRDLLFDAKGTLVSVEEATTLDAVPAAVKTALEARGHVVTVEQVTKGKAVTYEATIERNGKKSEFAVNAAGKPVKS